LRCAPQLILILLSCFATNAAAESWCDAAPAAEFAALEPVDVQDDWFRVHRVAPGVFSITEARQYEGVTSFLVVGSQRAVLFDSGLGVAQIGDVVRRLTARPVTVINSHSHFDHVGGNGEFTDVRNLDDPFSRASARGEVSESLREYASATLAEERVCGALPAGVTSRVYAIPTWRVATSIRDGEAIDLGGRSLEVLGSPGHTPDSLSLLDRANGLLFTGDTYYSGELYLWAPETDLAAYMASIGKLAGLAPGLKMIFPAHGPPVAEPARLLELQQALREIREGTAGFEPADEGRRLYLFEHFSILTAASQGGSRP
jgi:glyoxylase-like metal-dependent hydrolase (beta-lactamase superfamily II)